MENSKGNVTITLEHYEQLNKIAQGLKEKKNISMYGYSQYVYLIDENETYDYFLIKIKELNEKVRLAEEKLEDKSKLKKWFQ
jgi:hypothetical protein